MFNSVCVFFFHGVFRSLRIVHSRKRHYMYDYNFQSIYKCERERFTEEITRPFKSMFSSGNIYMLIYTNAHCSTRRPASLFLLLFIECVFRAYVFARHAASIRFDVSKWKYSFVFRKSLIISEFLMFFPFSFRCSFIA